MPLGAGVDHNDKAHEDIIARFKEPKAIVHEWLDRLQATGGVERITIEELEHLLVKLDSNEDDLIDFYWQSSSAECPNDNWRTV